MGLIPTVAILFCFLVLPHLLSKFLSNGTLESATWSSLCLVLQLLIICLLIFFHSRKRDEAPSLRPASRDGLEVISQPARLQDIAVVLISRLLRGRTELLRRNLAPGLQRLFQIEPTRSSLQNDIFLHHTVSGQVTSFHIAVDQGIEVIPEVFVKNSRGPNNIVACRVSEGLPQFQACGCEEDNCYVHGTSASGKKTYKIPKGTIVGAVVLTRR